MIMPDRLDHALLQELKMLMEDDFGALLEAYLEDSQRQIQDVSDAWEAGDLERLRRGAHSLKGASANIGAAALAALCSHLEELAGGGDAPPLAPLLQRVRAELRDVRDAVAALHAGQ